jgi:serine/threonine-protein kinase
MPLNEEHSFGQVALRLGFVTAEQIREGIEIQQKIRSLGGKPKMLGEILFEKGYLTAEQINRVFEAQQARQSQAKVALKVPGYEILAKIGQGGMGAVYKARQVRMDRVVALKILPPRLARDRQFVDRFLQEARAVAKLRHENIVLGIDAGEAEGVYFFAMEYVEGETLQQVLRREGRIDERRALNAALQVARALQHAYEHHMVHRDIKPDNMLVAKDGVVKLCDLGLAKEQKADPGLTQAGMAVGTPHYISPEQARGEGAIDIRSDLYSLGAALYHLAVGEVPFSGPTPAVVMTKHVTTPAPAPREKVPALSEAFNDLVLKCMAKHREHRFQTPAQLIQAIEKILASPPPPAGRAGTGAHAAPGERVGTGAVAVPSALRRRSAERSPMGGLVVGAVVLAVAAGVFFILSSDRPAPPAKAPRTPPKVAPATNDAAAGELQDRLRDRQLAVERFFESDANLKDLPALYADLEAFARDAQGTASAKAAAGLFDDFRGRVNAKSDEAWRAVRAAAEEPLRKGRLAEALARHRAFPPLLAAFRSDPAKPAERVPTRGGREWETAVRDLQIRIRTQWLQDVQAVTQALTRGDVPKAWETGRAMAVYATAELLQEKDPELAALPGRRDEQLAAILAHEVESLGARRAWDAARARCGEVERDATLPEPVRRRAAALAGEIAVRAAEQAGGLRRDLWTSYQGGPARALPPALEARDFEAARQALARFLYEKPPAGGGEALWLPGVDYAGRLRALLGGAPPAAGEPASLVASIERVLGAGDADAQQDAARAALLDVRAVLLLDDLFRQAEAGVKALAASGEAVNLATVVNSEHLRPVFPGARAQFAVERDGGFLLFPYGKAAPRIGFVLRRGGEGRIVEEDVADLALRAFEANARRAAREDPRQRFKTGLLFFTSGRRDAQKRAAADFEAARKGGVPALARYVSTLDAAGAAAKAQAAILELEKMKDFVRVAQERGGRWPPVRLEMNKFLAEYGHHPALRDRRKEIEELQAVIEAQSAKKNPPNDGRE